MKNHYEMQRTRDLRARFERLRREVESLEQLPDVCGDFEPLDASVFAEISAALDERNGVAARPNVTSPRTFLRGLRG